MPHDPEPTQIDGGRLRQLLRAFPFERQVLAVHLHHTRRPRQDEFRGLETLLEMRRYHTRDLGLEDLAQHLTVAPDGSLWTGRSWNLPPASVERFNGNDKAGPFMITLVGDFDRGRDRLGDEQRAALVRTLALLHERFGLEDRTLVFHSDLSDRSCPGSGIDRKELLREVRDARRELRRSAPATETSSRGPFGQGALEVQRLVRSLSANGADGLPTDAELPEAGSPPYAAGSRGDHRAARGGFELTPAVLSDLAPHVINLNQGRLSTKGSATTSPGEVRAIFEDHLPRELEAAREAKRPLRVVFYAHGGLVGEKRGLGIAYKHLEWWRRNGVYPINFVWETGFFETLRGFLPGRRALASRGIDWVPDRLIEKIVRKPGRKVWAGMKSSAARAVDPPPAAGADPTRYGGARFAAELLAEFVRRHDGAPIEIHAVGHSAGAIFLSHFVPTLVEQGVRLASTQLLAPAITIRDFERRLAGEAGGAAGPVTLYNLEKSYEEADEVWEVYDKSLIYLIHRVLEPEDDTPILGYEVSLRNDPEMRRLFGLAGPSSSGEVVWAPTAHATGRRASTAKTHTAFDDDPPTMNAVVRRVLDASDQDEIVDFAPFLQQWEELARGDRPEDEVPELALADELRELLPGGSFPGSPVGPVWQPATPSAPLITNGGGRKRALCVGIDRYATSPLSGCVADARLWAETLVELGFEEPRMLLDDAATRSAILEELEELTSGARAGDVVVFQFAGHGTTVPDVVGDEGDGTDEALCPIDWDQGRVLIDDDLAALFTRLPAGVNLTCFMDCCHSGTNTRLVAPRPVAHPDPAARPRYVVATREVQERHRELRRRSGAARAGAASRGPATMTEVSFAACHPDELAWESGGQGEFTLHATRLLQGGARLTHEQFEHRVRAAFGPAPRQKPLLDCAPAARGRVLLERVSEGAAANGHSTAAAVAADPTGFLAQSPREVSHLLRSIADLLT